VVGTVLIERKASFESVADTRQLPIPAVVGRESEEVGKVILDGETFQAN
tara:strand:- start:19 stop:165 length:147 start_codon:yes stop_codon:yes gene_type:complete